MSEFRKIVENAIAKHATSLKEWDDAEALRYLDKHPDDHTGDHEVEWNFDLPLNDELRSLFIKGGIANSEDLVDDAGNPLTIWQDADVKVAYDVEGYPDDEEANATNIYLKTYNNGREEWTDITSMLPAGYLGEISSKLTYGNIVDLHQYDDVAELRSDYYKSVL